MSLNFAAAMRGSVRQLRRDPVAAFFISVTIAIGIAATTAIFTVAHGVLLQPLPYRDPEALVVIEEFQPAMRLEPGAVAFGNLGRYRAMNGIATLTAFSYSELVVSGDADAERVIGANVDGDLFTTLGSRPALGRGIEGSDIGDSPARVAVLSQAFWRRRYGGDAKILGRSIVIDGVPFSVIGVTDVGFEFPRNPSMDRDVEVWVPRRPPPMMMQRRGARDLTLVARLRSGGGIGRIRQELDATMRTAEQENAALNRGWLARPVPLREIVIGRVRPAILMLAAAAALLLLIACANTSAAMLARTIGRAHAYGMRVALGAGRGDVVGLVLFETTLLAVIGTSLAVPMSIGASALLLRLAPVAVPRQQWITFDVATGVFLLSLMLVVTAATAIGAIAWLQQLSVRSAFVESRTGAGSRGRTRVLATFVISQLALGTVLLAATLTLYVRWVHLSRIDPGFAAANVTTATIPIRGMRYRDGAMRWALTNQLLERVRRIPGIERAATASLMPLSGGLMAASYRVIGQEAKDSSATAGLRAVSPDFFRTLGIAIKRGRAIESNDVANAPPVAVVNEAFVRQALSSGAGPGTFVTVTPPGADGPTDFQIIGVAGNAKEKDLLSPDTPMIYFSDAQASFPHVVLAVRSPGPAPVADIRRALRDLDPSLALDDIGPLEARVRATFSLQYFLLNILAAFAASAIILIGVGVYAAVSYAIHADQRSIGIRIALGSTPARIQATLLGRSLRWSVIGCGVGLVASTALLATLRSPDVLTAAEGVGLGAVAMVALAITATWRPALHASRTDPLRVLNAQ
jgi:putative ABC transport system permease protein